MFVLGAWPNAGKIIVSVCRYCVSGRLCAYMDLSCSLSLECAWGRWIGWHLRTSTFPLQRVRMAEISPSCSRTTSGICDVKWSRVSLC